MDQRRNHERNQRVFEMNDYKHSVYQKLWVTSKTRANDNFK